MRPGARSRTAEATSAMRAAHLLLDEAPAILDDRYAYRLLVPPTPWGALFPRTRAVMERAVVRRMRWLGSGRGRRLPLGTRRMRAQVVTRSRYAEDRLAAAMTEGIDQYVLLGAGLDSFALRAAEEELAVSVFEVDHPETQAAKRSKILAIDHALPATLELVPCDFEKQTLAEALSASTFDFERPAVLAWLGVSYYLSIEAIRATMEFVSGLAPGTELVLDYWTDDSSIDSSDRMLLESVRTSVSIQGEPMGSFFDAEEIVEEGERAGLTVVEGLSAAAIKERYLEGRIDGLKVPEFARLITLAVRS